MSRVPSSNSSMGTSHPLNGIALDDLAILERHVGTSRAAILALCAADWQCHHLSDVHMRGVAALLTQNQNLRELSLARNRISDVGMACLAAALPLSTQLRVLWLSGNRVGDAGAEALACALSALGWRSGLSSPPQLQELWLAANHIADAGVAALTASLPKLHMLRKLDLRSNRVGDSGAVALAAVMPELRLHELYLQENRIGDHGASAIGEVMPQCPWLRELRLTGNRVGDDGAAALASGLNVTPWLHALRLSSNRIGDRGAAALADALPQSQLERLELAYNPRIGDAAASALASSVPLTRLLALEVEGWSAALEAERKLALALLKAAVFGVEGGFQEDECRTLSLRQLHGIRLVSHVRWLGVLSDELRDELDNGVLLDELRRHRGVRPAPSKVTDEPGSLRQLSAAASPAMRPPAMPTPRSTMQSSLAAAHGPQDTFRVHRHFPSGGDTRLRSLAASVPQPQPSEPPTSTDPREDGIFVPPSPPAPSAAAQCSRTPSPPPHRPVPACTPGPHSGSSQSRRSSCASCPV